MEAGVASCRFATLIMAVSSVVTVEICVMTVVKVEVGGTMVVVAVSRTVTRDGVEVIVRTVEDSV